jgi:hypothetical protein
MVKSGLAGIDMAERLGMYRQAALQLDIADALEPIRSRTARRFSAASATQLAK